MGFSEGRHGSGGRQPMPVRLPVFCDPVAVHASAWNARDTQLTVPLNVQLDGRIVPSAASPDGARIDFSHVVVLDGLFGENERGQLWDALIGPTQTLEGSGIHNCEWAQSGCPGHGRATETGHKSPTKTEPHHSRLSSQNARQLTPGGSHAYGARTGSLPEVHTQQDGHRQQQQRAVASRHGQHDASPAAAAAVAWPGLAEADDQSWQEQGCGGSSSGGSSSGGSSSGGAGGPPGDRWERRTADRAGLPGTWGLRTSMLDLLASGQVPAAVEIQTRLCRLFPDYLIGHMPSEAIERSPGGSREPSLGAHSNPDPPLACPTAPMPNKVPEPPHAGGQVRCNGGASSSQAPAPEAQQLADAGSRARHDSDVPSSQPPARDGEQMAPEVTEQAEGACNGAASPRGHCSSFLGNAAVCGDLFQWHVDADPSGFPEASAWTTAYGQYCNREPGRPMFVSLLLYLDSDWPRDWAAETLFLDAETDVGFAVRPKPFRAILMDQDVLHRVSAPSALAGPRPRYSLVWKLVFFPRDPHSPCSIVRPEWGPPASIGSANRVQQVIRGIAGKRKRPG